MRHSKTRHFWNLALIDDIIAAKSGDNITVAVDRTISVWHSKTIKERKRRIQQ